MMAKIGSMIYEYEDVDANSYIKFLIDYKIYPEEKSTREYPGWPSHCELINIKCLQINDDKDYLLDREKRKEMEDWFNDLVDSDKELWKKICNLCYEDIEHD